MVTKTATLRVNQTSDNGASIHTQRMSSTDNNRWNVNVNTNIGYHWKISLDNNWNFMSDNVSIITLEVDSDLTISGLDRDFIFAFSQNNTKYFATFIELDTDGNGNFIYPNCRESGPPFQQFVDGDINALLNQNMTYFDENEQRESDRWWKSRQGDDYRDRILPDFDSDFPLNIKLTNNPIEGWSKWENTNPSDASLKQSCVFEPFLTDQPLDIFIYGDDIGEELNIKSFKLTYEYFETSAPTSTPTEPPTASDSTTSKPTTLIPTISISSSPTSQIATYQPTSFPTVSPMEQESTSNQSATNDNAIYIFVGAAAMALLCCVGTLCVLYKSLQRNRQKTKNKAESVSIKLPKGEIGDNVEMTNLQSECVDDLDNSKFAGNLLSLQVANNLTMEDVVDEMQNVDHDDNTPGQGIKGEMSPNESDINLEGENVHCPPSPPHNEENVLLEDAANEEEYVPDAPSPPTAGEHGVDGDNLLAKNTAGEF